VSVVWVALQSTPDGDELVSAHLAEHKKVRNIRNDSRVAVTIVSVGASGQGMRPYLSIDGTARIVEGGAPELLKELNPILGDPNMKFPPDNAPPGYLTRIRIDKVGGIGPWAS
jgi:Pyridoxamine 5'-phosphate oxidase